MSNDLKVATIYVMPLMGSVPVTDAIAALARNKYDLRHRLSQDLTLKYAPDLRFRRDETFDEASRIDALLRSEKVQADIAKPERDGED